MKFLKRSPLGTALVSAALLLAAAQGCNDSGDDNVAPPDINGGSKNTAGSKSTAGSKNNGGSAGNTSTDTGGGGDDGGAGPGASAGNGGKGGTTGTTDAGSGNDGGSDNPPVPECDKPETGADGCFNCPKDKDVEQWLNRCTDGDCLPFDNKARLPKLKTDGSVPPLPT